MKDTVKLLYKDTTYEFPLIEGSENELGIEIKNLRANTGLITYDPGYKNTGSCQSGITYLDGAMVVKTYYIP